MTTPQRGARRSAALEARRCAAARLFQQSQGQAAVMRALGGTRQTAPRGDPLWRRRGRDGLKATRRLGRKPRLALPQPARVERALVGGAQRAGFPPALWTLARVGAGVERPT